MHNKELDFPSTAQLRQRALSLWDNEGGSGPCGPQEGFPSGEVQSGLDLARDMAIRIAPRPRFTAHRLTIHAAVEMISLIGRAAQFRVVPLA